MSNIVHKIFFKVNLNQHLQTLFRKCNGINYTSLLNNISNKNNITKIKCQFCKQINVKVHRT